MSKSLLKSTTIVSINTTLSRISGFLRDLVCAHLFGAMAGFDAFIVAFQIPNFLRRLSAEGTFSQAFVPVLAQYRVKHDEILTKRFIDDMTGTMTVALTVITIIAILVSPLIISLFAPGFLHSSTRFVLATHMLRVTFPYLVFISLASLGAGVLNTYDSFGIPAFAPILLNLIMMGMAILAAPYFKVPVYALAWGVFIAGIVQFVFQLPFLHQKHLMPVPRVNFSDPGVRRVLKLMAPAIFGVSVVQLGILIDTIFASFLNTGSVSWIYYSNRLMNFPLGVFGVAIATVILPKLSRHHANKDHDGYSQTLDWAIRLLLLIGLPSSVAMFILAGPLLSTLFQGGQFKAYDVLMARQSLMTFAIGIQAFMLIKVLASAFYSRQDIKTPVKIAVVAVVVNMLCNAAFIIPLKHAGLALATSCGAFVNFGLLMFFLKKQKIYTAQPGWGKYALQLMIANGLLALFLIFSAGDTQSWVTHHFLWRFVHLSGLVIFGMLIYFTSLVVSGLRVKSFGF
ncbi:MAG: murein biosynthesis integral membrane protein MurJ [Gammaproteobacteria bacterium]|nr:murein biosynthesis integral membrane protein MurJ [Gammaproteobacteria bacterium]